MTLKLRAPRRLALLLLLCCLTALAAAQTAKRPLQHHDYDSWRAIVTPQLSPDGKFVVYGLFPQDGDGEIVVRNVQSGQDVRQAAGARPEPPRPDPLAQVQNPPAEGPPQARGLTMEFSPDGRYVVVNTFATKADVTKAKK